VVRVGDALRDPDDGDRIVGYDGIFTGAGHVPAAATRPPSS
jgi:hypothetical protein